MTSKTKSQRRLVITSETTFNQLRAQVRKLTDQELREEYYSYRNLQAKSVGDTLIEITLENEYHRRKDY